MTKNEDEWLGPLTKIWNKDMIDKNINLIICKKVIFEKLKRILYGVSWNREYFLNILKLYFLHSLFNESGSKWYKCLGTSYGAQFPPNLFLSGAWIFGTAINKMPSFARKWLILSNNFLILWICSSECHNVITSKDCFLLIPFRFCINWYELLSILVDSN